MAETYFRELTNGVSMFRLLFKLQRREKKRSVSLCRIELTGFEGCRSSRCDTGDEDDGISS
jgi:hypothetical protein